MIRAYSLKEFSDKMNELKELGYNIPESTFDRIDYELKL